VITNTATLTTIRISVAGTRFNSWSAERDDPELFSKDIKAKI
jgi:hypothetical protein